ncbi:hypothetical protein L5515_006844 [Caenorhabditis briggsae]|uniref:Glycosyltransferase family 92 protein n=1 Tax=Caenorhabditis briggsae TaxID=6238 RepID=A0AAE9F373_CAEBR|nr:hypothetical protein L5515_006844 [Caenorhabditis briggsae]
MRIIWRYEGTIVLFLCLFLSVYIVFYLLINLVIGIAHMILPHEPPKNRDLKAFVTSAYFYPTSKSLGSNSIALVMSMNLGQFKQDYLEIQSGKPMDSTEIVIWAKNGTHSRLVSTPYIRVTPHDNCQMITVFATVQLIPNVNNILLISDDGSTEVPFTLPDYQKRELVVCWSPLYVTEQWQNFILAMHIYKKFGGFIHIYLISCISSLFALMKKYESAGYLKIHPWYRVNFPFIHPLHVDPYVGIELQNQASSHTDCLLQYKESAEFITFLDMDEILIPRSAPTYVEEFQKILNNRKHISHIEFSIENYKMTVARDSLKFSIPQMLATLKYTYSPENSRKIVAIPRNLNFTWIYPVPVNSNGMDSLRTDENVITKLKTIKWKWNEILAKNAQKTADGCPMEPFIAPNFGQNVYVPYSSKPFKNPDGMGANAVAQWVDDLSLYTWKSLKINENPAKLRRFNFSDSIWVENNNNLMKVTFPKLKKSRPSSTYSFNNKNMLMDSKFCEKVTNGRNIVEWQHTFIENKRCDSIFGEPTQNLENCDERFGFSNVFLFSIYFTLPRNRLLDREVEVEKDCSTSLSKDEVEKFMDQINRTRKIFDDPNSEQNDLVNCGVHVCLLAKSIATQQFWYDETEVRGFRRSMKQSILQENFRSGRMRISTTSGLRVSTSLIQDENINKFLFKVVTTMTNKKWIDLTDAVSREVFLQFRRQALCVIFKKSEKYAFLQNDQIRHPCIRRGRSIQKINICQ